jgi:hypothetical protein
MARTPLNEDLVHLYIMTSLYIQETDVVKVGIGKDPIKRAREVGGEVRFRTKTPQLRQITLYMEKIMHLRLSYLYGYAKVRKRSGSNEWFNCSFEESYAVYRKVRTWVLIECENLSEIKAMHLRLKRKWGGKRKKIETPKISPKLTRTVAGGQMEMDL